MCGYFDFECYNRKLKTEITSSICYLNMPKNQNGAGVFLTI